MSEDARKFLAGWGEYNPDYLADHVREAVSIIRRLLAENERLREEKKLTAVAHGRKILLHRWLQADRDALVDALEHCGYDPEDCIDCGGPPHNDTCRFWKLRHVLSYWEGE